MTPTDLVKAASSAPTRKRSGIRAQIYSLREKLIKDKPFCILWDAKKSWDFQRL